MPVRLFATRYMNLRAAGCSQKRRYSGKGVVRQWFDRRQRCRFPKICSRLGFPEIACRTWKNGNLMMARTAGFRVVRVQTERPSLVDSRRAASPSAQLILNPDRNFDSAVWMGAVWSSLANTSAGPDEQSGKDFIRRFLT